MSKTPTSPAQRRAMFGANLRKLAAGFQSVSDLARRLKINRAQFNRYLNGDSFPRPDVLGRICDFFDVDGRILLEPLEDITGGDDPIVNPYLRDFLGAGAQDVNEEAFPSGFYRFARRSFVKQDVFLLALVYVTRRDRITFIRGFEAKEAMRLQELPTTQAAREFRGLAIQQDDGIGLLVARQNAITCSYNFINRVASFQNNFWVGYVTRTIPEVPGEVRVTRMVYEHLGRDTGKVLAAARESGYCDKSELLPFHRRLLRVDEPFA